MEISHIIKKFSTIGVVPIALMAIAVLSIIVIDGNAKRNRASLVFERPVIPAEQTFEYGDGTLLTVELASTTIRAKVAESQKMRMQGLSGTDALPEGEGLLLVFSFDGEHGIWMKEMQYELDIVWFDSDWNIVHIEESVMPDSFPYIYLPAVNARYVLEVSAGTVAKHALTLGMHARIIRDTKTDDSSQSH